jgi:hypothetical protein
MKKIYSFLFALLTLNSFLIKADIKQFLINIFKSNDSGHRNQLIKGTLGTVSFGILSWYCYKGYMKSRNIWMKYRSTPEGILFTSPITDNSPKQVAMNPENLKELQEFARTTMTISATVGAVSLLGASYLTYKTITRTNN